MKLLPEIEFHEDIRLFVYKPHGVINEATMNEVIGVIENLEAKLQEPFITHMAGLQAKIQ